MHFWSNSKTTPVHFSIFALALALIRIKFLPRNVHATRHLSWNWTSCFKVWAFLQKLNRKTEKQKVFGKRWLLGKCSFFYRRSPIAGSSGTGPLISCPSRLVCGSRQALASFPHERETTETEFQWGARKAFLLLLLRSFLSFVSTRPILL